VGFKKKKLRTIEQSVTKMLPHPIPRDDILPEATLSEAKMNIPLFRQVVLLDLVLAIAPIGCLRAADPQPSKDDQRVHKLFESMQDGKYAANDFPELTPAHIPALFEFADSTKVLKSFHRAPESSQFEAECSEGMVALWLIECVRAGGKYPSLNSLCFKTGVNAKDWAKASETNHKDVLKAYRVWWEKAKALPPEEAKRLDPLKGTGLRWY
jgi:hypothetical protein